MSRPSAQPYPDHGPDDHHPEIEINGGGGGDPVMGEAPITSKMPSDWEDVSNDVFLFEETMLQEWTDRCDARIICIEIVDCCIYETIKICTPQITTPTDAPKMDSLQAEQSTHPSTPLPPHTFKKVSDFPVPHPKPKKIRGAELNKSNFIKSMDKTYFSIRRLTDIEEVSEEQTHPPTSPTPHQQQIRLSKITENSNSNSSTLAPSNPEVARTKVAGVFQTRPNPTTPSQKFQNKTHPPKQPAWKVELSRKMKTKKNGKNLPTPQKSDNLQKQLFKSYFSTELVTLKEKSEAEVGISSKKQDPPPPDKMTLCSSSSSTRTTENILVKNIKAKPKSKVSSLLKIFESKSEARDFNQSE